MLFTHFGVSGPLVLSASAHMRETEPECCRFSIDLKPALNDLQLDERLKRDLIKYSNNNFGNSLGDLLPSKLIPVFISLSGIDPAVKSNQITKEMPEVCAILLKNLIFDIKCFRPVEEAVVTSGGIRTDEVDPKDYGVKACQESSFCGRNIGCRCLYRGIQPPNRFFHRICGRKRIAAMTFETLYFSEGYDNEIMINIAIDGPAGAGKKHAFKDAG